MLYVLDKILNCWIQWIPAFPQEQDFTYQIPSLSNVEP